MLDALSHTDQRGFANGFGIREFPKIFITFSSKRKTTKNTLFTRKNEFFYFIFKIEVDSNYPIVKYAVGRNSNSHQAFVDREE